MQVSPEYRAVHLQMEISRERVPLRNGYKMVGQRLRLRVNSGAEVECTGGQAVWQDGGRGGMQHGYRTSTSIYKSPFPCHHPLRSVA